MTDQTTPTLGKLITGIKQRDAIHIAVAPVVATERLNPGQHIGFCNDTDTIHVCAIATNAINAIGIVDPFLTGGVQKGDQFWMFLFPQTITSLRHDWTHPAFDTEQSESVTWLKNFCIKTDISYETLISALKNYIENEEIYCLGFDTPDELWSQREELWSHFEKATGIRANEVVRENVPFRCAC